MVTYEQMRGIRERIRLLDASVARKVSELVAESASDDALRAALFIELRAVCEDAFSLAAELARAVYNGWRIIELGAASDTVAASTFDAAKFDDMAWTALSKQTGGEIINVVSSYAGYNIRQSYTNTLMASAARDKVKPKFARVPQGAETCGFCMMLASRGFEYANGKNGERVHNHANCDCIYVASWAGNPKADGYDPDEWYRRWKDSQQH